MSTKTRRTLGSALSPREREVLTMAAQGHVNKVIAHRLHISEGTVGDHLKRIYQKLGCRSRVSAAVWACKQGWV